MIIYYIYKNEKTIITFMLMVDIFSFIIDVEVSSILEKYTYCMNWYILNFSLYS